MVTDEMIEKAQQILDASFQKDYWISGPPEEATKRALEAALSAAEPVAWQPRYKQEVIDHLRTVSENVSEYAMTVFPTKDQAEEYGHGGHQVRPLYVAPALAVVSKELPYHCDVCSVPGYGDAPCSPLCDRSALSAQVQDVAGWQLVPIKPTKAMAYAAACEHYGKKRVDQTGIEGISMTVNGIDYNFPTAFRKFWKGALAAAPVKQEG